MDFGAIIGVVLGMVLVFSLLSIIVTQINTLITNGFRLRARILRTGIKELITDPAMRAQILSHPLVRVVDPKLSDLVAATVRGETSRSIESVSIQVTEGQTLTGVTWVEPKIFTDALFGILSDNAERLLYAPFYDIAKTIRHADARENINDVICQLSTNVLSVEDTRKQFLKLLADEPSVAIELTELLDQLRDIREDILRRNRNQTGDLIPLLEGVNQITGDNETKRALHVLIGSAKKFDDAKERVSSWFDSQMNRLSEHYARRLALITTIVGVIIAIALNIDAIQLARALWEDPVLRDGAQQVAQTASVALEQAIQQSVPTPQPTTTPDPASTTDPNAVTDPIADADFTAESQAIANAVTSVGTALNSLSELRLPIGWYNDPAAAEACFLIAAENQRASEAAASEAAASIEDGSALALDSEGSAQQALIQTTPPRCDDKRNLAQLFPVGIPNGQFDFGLFFAKVLGWAITTLAIGQGSPFWFDILKKVTGR